MTDESQLKINPKLPLEDQQQIKRFIQALHQATVVNGVSQRKLCDRLEIQIGTFTKYIQGEIRPLKVATGIQAKLAEALGVTLDALVNFYVTGELATHVTVRDVESWLRSDAGQEDLPVIMASLQKAGERWLSGSQGFEDGEKGQELTPYTWPLQEIKELGLSEKMRERLGLTDADLEPLVKRGEFSDDLVEAFSIAANYELDAVREAFTERKPVA